MERPARRSAPQVSVSGDPTPRVYGPDALDGNGKAYLFVWDPAKKAYVAKTS